MASEESAGSLPVVHALLVCRGVEADPGGEISIENVVEVMAIDKVPGDVGPITFVAFVRNLPAGAGEGAFVLQAPGSDRAPARLPLQIDVPAGFEGRQLALQVTLPSLPVGSGGWFEVHFEWQDVLLATNRFAVGLAG